MCRVQLGRQGSRGGRCADLARRSLFAASCSPAVRMTATTASPWERSRPALIISEVEPDRALSAPSAGEPRISRIERRGTVRIELTPRWPSASRRSFHARPNTVGRVHRPAGVDVVQGQRDAARQAIPLLRDFHQRRRRHRNRSVDGHRGRRPTSSKSTEPRWIRRGKVIEEEFLGPGHAVPGLWRPSCGRTPLMWVSTDNNMVSESGPTEIRYAPAPEGLQSDRRVARGGDRSARLELHAGGCRNGARREKSTRGAAPGSGRIPNARRFVHVEACTELENAAVTFRSAQPMSPAPTGTTRTAACPRSGSSDPVVSAARCPCRPAPVVPTRFAYAPAHFRLVPAQRPRPADRARSRCSESTRSLVSVSAISRSRRCSTGRAAFLCRSTETGASSRSRNGDAPFASIGVV